MSNRPVTKKEAQTQKSLESVEALLGVVLDSLAEMESSVGERMLAKDAIDRMERNLSKRDDELHGKRFLGMLHQICAMREDFLRLCSDMEGKLDVFTARDVLESFKAYSIDMENILLDAGVEIGPTPGEKVDTVRQRIVGVVQTSERDLDGTVAERLSEAYIYENRILSKEKVKVYRRPSEGGVSQ